MVRFSRDAEARLAEILSHYPNRQAALIPVLHLAQREFGWISPECVEYVASRLGLAPSAVDSVLSFYTMFHRRPVGKYVVQVCRTLTCSAVGAGKIMRHLRQRLGIEPGQTTPDGRFTLQEVECLGACDLAPVMMINDDLYVRLTEERVDEVLTSLP